MLVNPAPVARDQLKHEKHTIRDQHSETKV